jgi:hypothetical protein
MTDQEAAFMAGVLVSSFFWFIITIASQLFFHHLNMRQLRELSKPAPKDKP